MNERLREIRKRLSKNQSDFAEMLGIGQSTLAMMEVSKRDISDRHIKTICAICGVNETWLRTGEGEMFDSGGGDFVAELSAKYKLNAFQQNLVRIVYDMPPDYQEMILTLAKRLAVEESFVEPESDYDRTARIARAALAEYDLQQAELPEDKRA